MPLPKTHPDMDVQQLHNTTESKTVIRSEFRKQFYRASMDNIEALAKRDGSEDAKELFCHKLDDWPTMEKGCSRRKVFFHGTPMAPWTIHHLDKDYIFVIPKKYGPVYNKKEISGQEYFDKFLTSEEQTMLKANNLCPCLLPSGLIPQSLLRATSPHLGQRANDSKRSNDYRSPFTYVGDTAAGAINFSLYKASRMSALYHQDCQHGLIPIPRDSVGKTGIHAVGINSTGCENLGYVSGIIRITKM